jgi:thymidylate kinase
MTEYLHPPTDHIPKVILEGQGGAGKSRLLTNLQNKFSQEDWTVIDSRNPQIVDAQKVFHEIVNFAESTPLKRAFAFLFTRWYERNQMIGHLSLLQSQPNFNPEKVVFLHERGAGSVVAYDSIWNTPPMMKEVEVKMDKLQLSYAPPNSVTIYLDIDPIVSRARREALKGKQARSYYTIEEAHDLREGFRNTAQHHNWIVIPMDESTTREEVFNRAYASVVDRFPHFPA